MFCEMLHLKLHDMCMLMEYLLQSSVSQKEGKDS